MRHAAVIGGITQDIEFSDVPRRKRDAASDTPIWPDNSLCSSHTFPEGNVTRLSECKHLMCRSLGSQARAPCCPNGVSHKTRYRDGCNFKAISDIQYARAQAEDGKDHTTCNVKEP
jgi:hypothetical protein